jgi:hypothetical protein
VHHLHFITHRTAVCFRGVGYRRAAEGINVAAPDRNLHCAPVGASVHEAHFRPGVLIRSAALDNYQAIVKLLVGIERSIVNLLIVRAGKLF